MRAPDVSVIVGVYNAMPYLTRCVGSVLEQTLPRGRMELIAVDDGSTDGSGEELDRLERAHPDLVRVLHQENSGGPAAPRNRGLDLATGRYVFFLDADDHLGPEALERMLAMAEANGSDVVLGKMVGVGGRSAPRTMFRRNQPKADLLASRVYWTLSPLKLFRRALIERLGLRFRTELRIGQDQPFVAQAYLGASVISVLADYDCYYWVQREDGNNITTVTRGTLSRLRFLRVMFELVNERVPAGPDRDLLLSRHFGVDVRQALPHLAAESDPGEQASAFEELREFVDRWYGEGVAARLPALTRLSLHLIGAGRLRELVEVVRFEQSGQRGKTVVEKGRVFGAYPCFRDPAAGVPDEHFDITDQLGTRHHLRSVVLDGTRVRIGGHAYIHRVDTDGTGTTEVVLRERGGGGEFRIPATRTPTPALTEEHGEGLYDYGTAGFTAEVDITTAADGGPLPKGLWDVFLAVRTQGVAKEVRIGCNRAPDVPSTPRTRVVRGDGGGAQVVTAYYTDPHGNLSLDIGENKHRVAPQLRVRGVAWADDEPGTLLVSGRAPAQLPTGALAVRLKDAADGGATLRFTAETEASGRFTARVPLPRAASGRPLPAGEWIVGVELNVADLAWTARVPARPQLATARWRRRGWPVYAKPIDSDGVLALRAGSVRPLAAVRRRARRAHAPGRRAG